MISRMKKEVMDVVLLIGIALLISSVSSSAHADDRIQKYLDNADQKMVDYYLSELNHGRIPQIEVPSQLKQCEVPEHCRNIFMTTAESNDILAAKYAHMIWLDGIVPWNLSDLSDDELDLLFNPDKIFDGYHNGYFYNQIVDYDPFILYTYMKNLSRLTKEDTIESVISDLRKDFRHGFVSDIYRNTSQSTYGVLTTYHDNLFGREFRVSIRGCHTSSQLIEQMLKNLNIPAYDEDGWFDGKGHDSLIIPGYGVLLHGDYIYNSELRGKNIFTSYSYFTDNITKCGRYSECAALETLRMNDILMS